MPAEATHPVIQIVDDDEDNVGTPIFSRSAVNYACKSDQTCKDGCERVHADYLFFLERL
jgi:hypothetical protein